MSFIDEIVQRYVEASKISSGYNEFGSSFTDKNKHSMFDEIGSTGTEIFSGVINEEYLNEWKSLDKRCKLITRMLRSDATVRAIYLVMTLPIESAKWEIKFDGDMDEKSKFIKEYCEKMLFDEMTITWQSFLRQVLSMLPYGFFIGEICYELDKENNVAKIRKIAPRLQKTIKKWFVDETGGLAGVEQQAYFLRGNVTEYKTVKIPVDKLVLFTYRQEGSNFEGDGGILRPAYKHWLIKDKLYLIQAIGLERFALGVPVIYLPRGATPEDRDYAKHIIKTWRAHEESGMIFPEGVKVDHIEGRFKEGPLQAAIEEHDKAIMKSVLAGFLNLGTGNTGSWALSKDQSDLFLMSLNSVTRMIEDTMNRYVIKPWAEKNFGKMPIYPQLVCENICKTSNAEVLQSLQALMGLGIIEKTQELVDWTHDKWDIPKGEMTMEAFQTKYGQQQEPQNGEPPVMDDGTGEGADMQTGASSGSNEVESYVTKRGKVQEDSNADSNYMKEPIKSYFDMKAKQTYKFAEDEDEDEYSHETDFNKIADEEIFKNYKALKSDLTRIKGITSDKIDNLMKYVVMPVVSKKKKEMVDKVNGLLASTQQGGVRGLTQFIKNEVNDPQKFADYGDYTDYNDLAVRNEASDVFDSFETYRKTPSAYFNTAGAPTFVDPKTRKKKYARGAVVDGEHVGGQWAPGIGKMLGLGGVSLTASSIINIALHNIRREFGREFKQKVKGDTNGFFERLVKSNTTLEKLLMWKPGGKYEFDGIGRIGSHAEFKLDSIWGSKLPQSGNFGGGKFAQFEGMNLPQRLYDLGIKPSESWERDLTVRLFKIDPQTGKEIPRDGHFWNVIRGDTQAPKMKNVSGVVDYAPIPLLDLIQKTDKSGLAKLLPDGSEPPIKFTGGNYGGFQNTSFDLRTLFDKDHYNIPKIEKGLQDALDNSAITKRNPAGEYIKGWQLHPGGIGNTTCALIAGGIAVALVGGVWDKLSKRAIGMIQETSKQVEADLTTPEEVKAYNTAIKDWSRMQSPTGGLVGRPRMKPKLPEHLKRKPGRPSYTETEAERKRRQAIEEYTRNWQQKQQGAIRNYVRS